jgi:MFS family permease
VLTSYTIAIAVLIPLSGCLADKFGTKRVSGFAVAVSLRGGAARELAQSGMFNFQFF